MPGVRQASFSGAQQRDGGAAFGFMMAGMWGPANWEDLKKELLALDALRRHKLAATAPSTTSVVTKVLDA